MTRLFAKNPSGEYVPVKVDASGNIVVSGTIVTSPTGGSVTDGSGAIASGSTSEQVFSANPTRSYLEFQNISDTDMFINIGADATENDDSFQVFANGGSIRFANGFVPTEAINVICASSGKKFVAKQG
jgi:hypothetical protein